MLDKPQHASRTAELDPDLLSTPFRVQTNWHVVTGAPCSGKTILIDQLADKGFRTVPEIGRQYFERELAKGRTINEIRENGVTLTHRLIGMQLRVEAGLRAIDVALLDRAFPDGLTFGRVAGLNRMRSCQNASITVMLPYAYSIDSRFSRTALGQKMMPLQTFLMSGWPAITVPWDIAL